MGQGAYLSTVLAIRIVAREVRHVVVVVAAAVVGGGMRVVVLGRVASAAVVVAAPPAALRLANSHGVLDGPTTHLRVEPVLLAEPCLRRLHHRPHELRRGRRRLADSLDNPGSVAIAVPVAQVRVWMQEVVHGERKSVVEARDRMARVDSRGLAPEFGILELHFSREAVAAEAQECG